MIHNHEHGHGLTFSSNKGFQKYSSPTTVIEKNHSTIKVTKWIIASIDKKLKTLCSVKWSILKKYNRVLQNWQTQMPQRKDLLINIVWFLNMLKLQ